MSKIVDGAFVGVARSADGAHENSIDSAVFGDAAGAETRALFTGDFDGRVCVWDVPTGAAEAAVDVSAGKRRKRAGAPPETAEAVMDAARVFKAHSGAVSGMAYHGTLQRRAPRAGRRTTDGGRRAVVAACARPPVG